MISTNQNNNLTNKNYLIITYEINGQGDLSCGMKVANDLHERLGIPVKNILISSNKVKGIDNFNKHNFKSISLKEIESLHKQQAVDLQIIAPTDGFSGVDCTVEKAPALALLEYGFTPLKSHRVMSKALGIGKEEIGILIDPSLKEWGFSEEAKSSRNRMQQLEQLDPTLKAAIMGKKSFDELNNKHALYMSYAPEKFLLKFIEVLSEKNHSSHKNNIFVLPNLSATAIKDLNLKALHFRKIKVIDLNQPSTQHSIKSEETETTDKKITIIRGRIVHSAMLTLMKATEREILVTGDQSLSEAIAGNKNFIYIAPEHKEKLSKDLKNLGYPVIKERESNSLNFLKREEISKLNKQVCNRKDYFENLTKLIKESLQTFQYIADISLEHLTNQAEFVSAIEMDKNYRITLNQLCLLEISAQDCTSPFFQDSKFEYQSLGNSRYQIKRISK